MRELCSGGDHACLGSVAEVELEPRASGGATHCLHSASQRALLKIFDSGFKNVAVESGSKPVAL